MRKGRGVNVNNLRDAIRDYVYKYTRAYADVILKGGAGSGNFGHEGRPGQVGGSSVDENSIDYEHNRYSHGKLLNKLKRFYKNEENGILHREDELFGIGADLADALEDFGSDSNAWKGDQEDFDSLLFRLRTNPSVVDIDQAVNSIHQSFIEDDYESQILGWSNNFREYILHRDELQVDYDKEMNEE